MTPAEFRVLMGQRSDAQLLAPCLQNDDLPFVFEAKPDNWNIFRDELAAALGVVRADIRIVGSGRLGFSMKPGAQLKGFSDKSDIDVVIVNPAMFDQLWFSMLDAAYPRSPMTERLGGWLEKRRNEVYTGWLSPLKISLDVGIFGPQAKPVLDFSTKWFNALKRASRHPSRRHEDITVRLYRTWRHAQLYHLDSLAGLRKSLAE
jgi:hypothetical protein